MNLIVPRSGVVSVRQHFWRTEKHIRKNLFEKHSLLECSAIIVN